MTELKKIVSEKHKVEIIMKSPAPLSFQFYLLGLRQVEASQVIQYKIVKLWNWET